MDYKIAVSMKLDTVIIHCKKYIECTKINYNETMIISILFKKIENMKYKDCEYKIYIC